MENNLKKYTTIDWKRALIMLMPPVLRKMKHASWLQVLLTPLSNIYDDTLYKMQHNGQVIYLEKVLNELFNKSKTYQYYETTQEKANNGLIFIDDADRPTVQYLYTHDEIENGLPPIVTYTQNPEEKKDFRNFLYLASDLDLSSTEYFNFRINIPEAILENAGTFLNEVKAIEKSSIPIIKKQRMIEEKSDVLVYDGKHPFSNHPDAVKIQTPRFHKVVNFYKLVAKSYETRRYLYTDSENDSDITIL